MSTDEPRFTEAEAEKAYEFFKANIDHVDRLDSAEYETTMRERQAFLAARKPWKPWSERLSREKYEYLTGKTPNSPHFKPNSLLILPSYSDFRTLETR